MRAENRSARRAGRNERGEPVRRGDARPPWRVSATVPERRRARPGDAPIRPKDSSISTALNATNGAVPRWLSTVSDANARRPGDVSPRLTGVYAVELPEREDREEESHRSCQPAAHDQPEETPRQHGERRQHAAIRSPRRDESRREVERQDAEAAEDQREYAEQTRRSTPPRCGGTPRGRSLTANTRTGCSRALYAVSPAGESRGRRLSFAMRRTARRR